MNHDFSFRMMQGKGGKSGHIKKEGQQVHLSFRHLPPSLPCTLYRGGRAMDTLPSSPQGTLQFTCRQDGFFFLCHEHTLLLWEEGENGSQNYFRAQKLIPRPQTPANVPPTEKAKMPDAPPENIPTPSTEDESPSGIPETAALCIQPASSAPENFELTPSAAQPDTQAHQSTPTDEPLPLLDECPSVFHDDMPQQAQTEPEQAETPVICQPGSLPAEEPIPPPMLNPRSPAPSVMTLPPLQWPPALGHLQAVFHTSTPYRPFWKPEFRCVKIPARHPALPYGIIGYQVMDSRVCALLHAVPGHPLIPPRGFEGAPYRDGHFIRIQPLPQT